MSDIIAKKCKIDNCTGQLSKTKYGGRYLIKGLCAMHYTRLRAHGNTETVLVGKTITHNLSKHPYYTIHHSMVARCERPSHPFYRWYGARGIKVCDEWHDVSLYINYIEKVLGPKPTPKHSIDRIDNSKGYEPGNIRWASKKEQADNRTYSRNTVTGVGNVYKLKGSPNYYVRMFDRGVCTNLGTYKSIDEAIIARDTFLESRTN